MKIKDIAFIAVQTALPAGKAYGMAKSLATARATTIVRLTLEDGTEGIGEAWGIPQVNIAMLPLLKTYLVGADVFDVEQVFALIYARHYHFGVQGALTWSISGIDMAAKDAAGKALKLPVHRLIGGRQASEVSIYASGGYLTENSERDFEPQIAAMAEAGHKAVKIKIGVSPANDEHRVATARRILGPDVEIMVDINSNYTFDLARESIARMAPHGIGWVEEPLGPQDIRGYELLQRWSPVPIATGEALYTVHDFQHLVERRAVDVLQPDLSLCGGLWQGRLIAALAIQHHLRLSPHVWGSGIGLAAAVHFVASLPVSPHSNNVPRPTLVEYDLGTNPLRDGLLRNPLRASGDRLAVPEAPGLGVEIDWQAVDRFAVR
ncbi:MAG: mandelate racemase/muconate lactonizing enzyme family protein [Phreatobacter sp.]|uniref:mandelate racemase/muconate lactonizing enzyme family protein n=1 Tax=Phreatobacter sp. TaxID=1966341 RepID=UPI001A5A527C|nr:mandelate racemase/muconate lactonizing enzyme family protein [Phreatobacter sp.]MBL8568414.1 mandelate racemase/muconate lactonizing enzyme family protein [Phreatobacter sp.]